MRLALVSLALAGLLTGCRAASPSTDYLAPSRLVTGRRISPMGPGTTVDPMPLSVALSPHGDYALVTSGGYRQGLWCLRTEDGSVVSRTDLPGGWYGMAVDGDGTVYASRGAAHQIAVLHLLADGTFGPPDAPLDDGDAWVAALALDGHGHLYAVNMASDRPGGISGVAVFDTVSRRCIGSLELPGPATFGTALAVAGDKVYLTNPRDDQVVVVDARNPANLAVLHTVAVGSHPNALCTNRMQSRLYVANAQSDTVSVIDTATDTVVQTIPLVPTEGRGLPGAGPTALTLSSDEKTLYVTVGDMNAVAEVDVAAGRLLGYTPVGAYPTALVGTPSGRLVVANGNGSQTMHPNPGNNYLKDGTPQYVLNLLSGSVSIVSPPTGDADREERTRLVEDDARLAPSGHTLQPFPPVEHVIYVIKENRTYDQVMGDVETGNGDASLTIFGSAVTPNQHDLARRFVLLDNYYANGDVSGSGWTWCTQGYANEWVVRTTPYIYQLPHGSYPNAYSFEGQIWGYPCGGFPGKDVDGNILSAAFPQGLPPVPDMAAGPNGFIWDAVRRMGLSYRNYGFFYSFGNHKEWPDNYPSATNLRPAGHDLEGASDADYRRFDLDYADSDGPARVGSPYRMKSYGRYHMTSRFAEWHREFQAMLAQGKVPAFMMLRLGNDHTLAMRGGHPTPRAFVADNDYAVGQLVDAVSHSPIWKHTAIFIVEDDAQNGADHVDAHRSTCLVLSPWIRKAAVDHHFYNTDSVLRTMELLLKVPPLSQYDAGAYPVQDWTATPANAAPFQAVLPAADILSEQVPSSTSLSPGDPRRPLIEASDRMDFVHADGANAALCNQIIWKSVHGPASMMPPPRGTAVDDPNGTDGDDD